MAGELPQLLKKLGVGTCLGCLVSKNSKCFLYDFRAALSHEFWRFWSQSYNCFYGSVYLLLSYDFLHVIHSIILV